MLTEFDNRRKHKLSSVITINLKKKLIKLQILTSVIRPVLCVTESKHTRVGKCDIFWINRFTSFEL